MSATYTTAHGPILNPLSEARDRTCILEDTNGFISATPQQKHPLMLPLSLTVDTSSITISVKFSVLEGAITLFSLPLLFYFILGFKELALLLISKSPFLVLFSQVHLLDVCILHDLPVPPF